MLVIRKKSAKMNICKHKKKRDKPADILPVVLTFVDCKYQTTISDIFTKKA